LTGPEAWFNLVFHDSTVRAVLKDILNFAEGGAADRQWFLFLWEDATAYLRYFQDYEEELCRSHYPRFRTLRMHWSLPSIK
jgi:hypothetical protein